MNADFNRILVTGATGLAGTGLIQHILKGGRSVKILGTYHGIPPFCRSDRIEYVRADLTKKEDCRQVAKGCDAAILAAANTGGAGAAQAEPWRQVTDNLAMDAFLLEAMHFAGVRRVIYISSATVYQEFDGFIKEDQLDWNQEPHASYAGVGWAKRSAEKICQFWHIKYDMEIIVVRAANIYGPFAKFDPQNSNFIPAIIRKAVEKLDPFEVWGNGEVTRDVIYVEDFANAVLRLLKRTDIKFDIFNLGAGVTTTVGEVVRLALKCSGHHPEKVMYTAAKPATIKSRALDCRKIKEVTGCEPAVSLEQGIQQTTRWWLENKNWWRK